MRWRRVAVAKIDRTDASQFARDLVHIQRSTVEEGVGNVGKRTPSDPMETGCGGKSSSDCRMSVRKRLSKDTGKYSCGRDGKCRQTDHSFHINRRHTIDAIIHIDFWRIIE